MQPLPTINALVLNLDRRPDRWSSFEAHTSALRAKNQLKFLASLTRQSATDRPDCPSLGCMKSHRDAVAFAREQKWSCVLVLEDDVVFPNDVDDRWNKLNGCLPPKAAVIFGACSQFANAVPYNECFLKLRDLGVCTATHCMIYFQEAYDKIIKILDAELERESLCTHVDLALCMGDVGGPIYLAVPFLAYYYESSSDVRRGKSTANDVAQLHDAEERALRVLQVKGSLNIVSFNN